MEKERKGSLFGPLFLIFIGILFLLNNLGVLPWDIWSQLIRLWPIFLIGAGLDLIVGRRSMLGSILVSVLIIALIAGGLWFVSTQMPSTPATTQEVSYALQDADRAEVHIDFGVGTLQIGALSESNNLLEGTLDLSKNEQLEEDYSVKQDAYLALGSNMPRMTFSTDLNQDKTWSLYLNRDVPLELDVNTGVGTARIDLRQLNLSDLTIDSGVGRTTVILPQRGRLSASIKEGVGEIQIQVPEGTGLRIEASTGLGDIKVPDGYQRSDHTYTSPGYGSADDRVDLRIESGIGRIVVSDYKAE